MESTILVEVNVVTKMFRVVDTTDYAAQGVSLSALSAKGLGTVRFNGDIVYQKLLVGDPLVNLATGATTSAWVACPLDSDNNPVYGTYTCDYSVRTALVNEDVLTVTAGSGGAGAFSVDNLDLREVLAVGDTFTISSSVAGNNGVKTITSIGYSGGDTTLYVSETVNAEVVVSSDLSFDITKATDTASAVYAGCTQITPSFTFDADCEYGLYGRLSIVDTTDVDGQTIVSRELTLQYPSWAATADVTSADGGIVLDAIATGTWTIANAYELSVTMGDLIVTYTASLTEERKVSCAGSLCGLLPCIQNLLQVHGAAVKTGFSPYQFFVDSILLNYVQAVEYKKCGEFESYQEKVAAIDALLDESGCECSCCDDDVLIWVVNATAGQANEIELLQAQIDALDARVTENTSDIVAVNDRLDLVADEVVTINDSVNALLQTLVFVQEGTLSQSGTNAPVYSSQVNTQADTMTFSRISAGNYRITFANPIVMEKVVPFLDTQNFTKDVIIYVESTTQIRINTFDRLTLALEDGVLLNSKLLIQFYQ